MLSYNLLVFTVVFLLYLDYLVEQHHTRLTYGESTLFLNNTFIYLSLAVMILYAGFRFEIGYDYPKYLAGYLYDSQLAKWEPLFNFFVRLSRYINFGLGVQMMLLFFSALTLAVVYRALRHLTPYYRWGILLYLLTPSLYLNSFSVIRQGIAIAILLYGLQYITTRIDYKKYALIASIAFMFHYSSIFVSLAYIIGAHFFKRTYSWIIYSFLILVSLFLSFAHIGKFILLQMPGHFSIYATYLIQTSFLKLLIINLFFLFFMVQKDHFIKTRLDRYLLNSVFIGLLIFNTFSDFVYVSRLAHYFLIAEIVLVPVYLYSIRDIFMRKVLMVLFALYYLFNYDFALYRDEHYPGERKNFLIPYKNYFFEEKKSSRTQSIESWYDFIIEYSSEGERGK